MDSIGDLTTIIPNAGAANAQMVPYSGDRKQLEETERASSIKKALNCIAKYPNSSLPYCSYLTAAPTIMAGIGRPTYNNNDIDLKLPMNYVHTYVLSYIKYVRKW